MNNYTLNPFITQPIYSPPPKKKTNNPILKHNVIHVMCNDKFYMAKGKITLKMPLETQVPDGNNTILS